MEAAGKYTDVTLSKVGEQKLLGAEQLGPGPLPAEAIHSCIMQLMTIRVLPIPRSLLMRRKKPRQHFGSVPEHSSPKQESRYVR